MKPAPTIAPKIMLVIVLICLAMVPPVGAGPPTLLRRVPLILQQLSPTIRGSKWRS